MRKVLPILALSIAPLLYAQDQSAEVRALWVQRSSLTSPSAIRSLVQAAKGAGFNTLLVQVRGRGDAYYTSRYEPRAAALSKQLPSFDPLATVLADAHDAGLRVHAWMNVNLVADAEPAPLPGHVIYAHPEWLMVPRELAVELSSVAPTSPEYLRRLSRYASDHSDRIEGLYVSPIQPAAVEHTVRVIADVAARYPIDGIHLDYIRQPSVDIGFDPTSRARFALEHGADPDPAWPAAPFHRLPVAERAGMDSAWGAFQQEQVTAIVREVRDSLNAVRPGIVLTAAVLADTTSALRRNRQAWSAWLRDGLLDRAFAMCYAPMVQTVMNQLAAMAGQFGTNRLVPGIAIYNTSPSICAAKIKGARALGFTAIALYSYDSLWERNDLWARLRDFVNGPRTPEEQP